MKGLFAELLHFVGDEVEKVMIEVWVLGNFVYFLKCLSEGVALFFGSGEEGSLLE